MSSASMVFKSSRLYREFWDCATYCKEILGSALIALNATGSSMAMDFAQAYDWGDKGLLKLL